MIDLHTHSFFSDGVLVPSELVRRAEYKGLKVIGITDHGDLSNIDFIIPRIVNVAEQLNQVLSIKVIPGIELTHVPPAQIAIAAQKAREFGARIIIVHGETLVEPVAPGTNHAALLSDIDILAHPGLIDEEDVILAREKGIFLEITARKGHSLSNGYVAALAKKHGAGLVINTDSHAPGDLIDSDFARKVVKGAGLSDDDFFVMQENASKFVL
ncbi:MAG: histidinol phosphate phosphatase domain-containing protein [Desulfobacteraceae bacterium]|jgi:histidinol phosphatase-like PHP family hydrolase